MGTLSDAPWADMAYKLVEYGDKPVLKRSLERFRGQALNNCFGKATIKDSLKKILLGPL